MGRPLRSDQFDTENVCIVHTIQRCVRRAFLAGEDPLTGKDFGYRREWIRSRLEALASVFAVDVLSFAILSNHIHLVLRNRPDVLKTWSDREVAIRWLQVYPGRRMDEQLGTPTEKDVDALVQDKPRMAEIRQRLVNLSWFMKSLSEPIARRANREDDCTGRFWEGRFQAQRITDEAGLLACVMYVDLNPVRAAIAKGPEQYTFTSAHDRIAGEAGVEIDSAAFERTPLSTEQAAQMIRDTPLRQKQNATGRKKRTRKRVRRDAWLAPVELTAKADAKDPQAHQGGLRASDTGFLSLTQAEYLGLLRWTAHRETGGSAEEMPASMKPLLSRLGFDLSMWRELVWNYKRYFGSSCIAGSPESTREFARRRGRHWVRGQRSVANFFLSV